MVYNSRRSMISNDSPGDSQVVINALYLVATSSRLMWQCKDALKRLGGTLLWVTDYWSVEVDEHADGGSPLLTAPR